MSLLSVCVCFGPLGGLFSILPSYSAKFSMKSLPKTKEVLPFGLNTSTICADLISETGTTL